MKTNSLLRAILLAGALCGVVTAQAQVLELRATINAAQETPVSTSGASGSAIMLYDVAANTFDLVVTINNMANAATLSHIHEGAVGVAGGVVTNLGSESVYTRNGNTLTATFRGLTYGGTKLTLIQGGAYYNIHSSQFPGGEVRGQLIPLPVRLVANFTVAQEQAAFPAVNLSGLNDFGGAVMLYDPLTNRVTLRMSIFNYNNPFTNSHFHEGAPGVSGPVRVDLGTNANAGNYTNTQGYIAGSADIPMTRNGASIDVVSFLSGNFYLNFHSSAFPNGELRGQVRVSNELPTTRISNAAVRGFVGTGDQNLIQGFTVSGPEPVRVLITAKGPSLSQYGLSSVLANPAISLHDSGGRGIAANNDIGAVAAGSELSLLPGVPTNSAESALVVVLPPGNYSVVVGGNGGTGIALLEITDLRNSGIRASVASTYEQSLALLKNGPPPSRLGSPQVAPELCVAPLPLATVAR